ncbi:response regulator [Halobaculum sp. CBA1158]|uniref:response regulator n=1 Tax=Halobaculum sp. CBA1158 TaxID=2904243 RepID=UPI001F319EE9|nr:response regulator [Halobaculum sp. CBA1158]UIO99518.1 response regulator [Halobaculum sp. CBA1158]
MNERVLVVEDSAFQRARLRDRLEPTFEVVAEAGDGEEAVAAYREHDPDAVTMDFALPVIDGPSATAAIKEFDPGAVVVFCTCVSQQAQLKRAIRAGADDYVRKPVSDGALVEAVRSAVDEVGEHRTGPERIDATDRPDRRDRST